MSLHYMRSNESKSEMLHCVFINGVQFNLLLTLTVRMLATTFVLMGSMYCNGDLLVMPWGSSRGIALLFKITKYRLMKS